MTFVAARNEILGSSSISDLININDQELASFLAEEAEPHRDLGEDKLFGQRCGNRNKCVPGLQCDPASWGNRCLPNTCLQDHSKELSNAFNITTFKEGMYRDAGYSEEQILAKLAEVKDERKFLQTAEFQALEAALLNNLEPLNTIQEISQKCVDPYTAEGQMNPQQGGTVSYVGLHIEASAIIDASIQYLVAVNNEDQRSILRLCLGAELGLGAEISYLFGFTNTATTANLLCGSAMADVDLFLLVTAGAAVGIGFNGVFFYEFTFGGGLGLLGLGANICTSFQYGNATVVNETLAF